MKVSFKHAHIQGLEPVTYSAYNGRDYINTIRFKDAKTGTMFRVSLVGHCEDSWTKERLVPEKRWWGGDREGDWLSGAHWHT